MRSASSDSWSLSNWSSFDVRWLVSLRPDSELLIYQSADLVSMFKRFHRLSARPGFLPLPTSDGCLGSTVAPPSQSGFFFASTNKLSATRRWWRHRRLRGPLRRVFRWSSSRVDASIAGGFLFFVSAPVPVIWVFVVPEEHLLTEQRGQPAVEIFQQ